MVIARVVIHVLARVLPHVLARVLLHVLARVIIHVHDYYLKTCILEHLEDEPPWPGVTITVLTTLQAR